MEIQIEDSLNKLKYQIEKLDTNYKAMVEICDEIQDVVKELDYDIHELEKEL